MPIVTIPGAASISWYCEIYCLEQLEQLVMSEVVGLDMQCWGNWTWLLYSVLLDHLHEKEWWCDVLNIYITVQHFGADWCHMLLFNLIRLQLVAWCHMNQWWLIIKGSLWHSFKGIFKIWRYQSFKTVKIAFFHHIQNCCWLADHYVSCVCNILGPLAVPFILT